MIKIKIKIEKTHTNRPTALLVLAATSCALNENSIISMTLGYALIVGVPVIDETERTITATVGPVDISNISPSFVTSSKAVAGEISLADGDACTCIVTTEDGTASEWTVTITVQPGISCKIDGTLNSFSNRAINCNNSDSNDDYGNGVPYISDNTLGTGYDYGYAYNEVRDFFVEVPDTQITMRVGLNNASSGFDAFTYRESTDSSTESMECYADVETTSYGEVRDWVIGTFSASGYEYFDGELSGIDPVEITDGYFKVLRLKDDLYYR